MGELERRGAGEVPSGAGRGTPDLRQTTPIGVSLPTSDADLRRALDNIQEGCQVLDRNGRYLYVNEAAARQGGRTREEMLGHTMPEAFPGIEPSEMLGAVTRCLESRTSSRLETEYPVPHGTTGWLDVCVETIPEGAFVLSVDISARKRVEQGLRTAAHFDLLTGLPNRSHLQTCFERLVGADRKCSGKLALLVVGVRRVQEVNFALGRRRGDALLRSVASRIRAALVESAEIARLDGDHFGVLLPDAGGDGVAARAAGAVLEAMDRSQCVDGLTVDVAARVGIALCPEHGTDFQTLLRNAEVALHAARQADSGHAVYDPAADRFTPRRLALMADLLPAIERQQFVLHYQPIVGLEAGSVLGFEALIRWKHPEHGMISPDEFISLAEHTGAIRPLTLWVLETALSTCRELRQAGWPLTMAVNISARSLGDAGFVEQLERILEKIGARPGWLDLELTESMVMSDSDRAREMLDRLGKLGLHISIDDFGTGYSSLGYLRKLPVHTLKIDRSFLGAGGPTPGRRDSAIIRAIVDVGRALGLTVVAEGVETEEALEALRQLGCDRAQGYHIARPMPAADVARWLTDSPWGLRSIGVSN